MPMYLQRTAAGFVFRRAVPAPLRAILDKREIKIPLGRDYRVACRRAREEAVRSDAAFDEASGELAGRQARSADRYADYQQLTAISELTDDLQRQLHAYWVSLVDAADRDRRATQFANDDRDSVRKESAGMLELLRAAWRDGNVDPLLPALHTALMVRGYRLDLPLDDERRLCLEYLRAAMAGYRLLEARFNGDDPPLALAAAPLPAGKPSRGAQPSPSPQTNGTSLVALFEYWRDALPGRTQRTIDDVEKRIKDLDALSGGKPAAELTKADLIAYRDERIKQGAKPRTVGKDLSFIKAVLNHAFDSDKLPHCWWSRVKAVKAKVGSIPRHLEAEDLQRLFQSPIYAAQRRPQAGAEDAAAWLPLLGLYTGARLEELCQLTLDDIKIDGKIPYLRIIDLFDEEDDKQVQRLKNEGSRRKIPIPKQLIDFGFLDYVAHQRSVGHFWLFPALKPDARYGRRGASWSKWWSRWRSTLGVTGRDKCFHAFRHVFKTACRGAGIGEDVHDALTGHAGGGTGRDYGQFPLEALAKAIRKVRYRELKIEWVWSPPTTASAAEA